MFIKDKPSLSIKNVKTCREQRGKSGKGTLVLLQDYTKRYFHLRIHFCVKLPCFSANFKDCMGTLSSLLF